MPTTRIRLLSAAVLLLPLLLAGCGQGKSELSGSVKYKNRPVVTGTVTVFSEGNMPHQAPIEQGKYELKNVPSGRVTMLVVSEDPNVADVVRDRGGRAGGPKPKEALAGTQPQGRVEGWFPIPKKYADVGSTPLKFELKSGKVDYDIVLVD